VGKEVDLIRNMLANLDGIHLHPSADRFLDGIIDTPLKAISFELGVISHYIADAHQPLHTDGPLRYPDITFNESTIHMAFEADVYDEANLEHLKNNVTIKTPEQIDDFEGYILERVRKINPYYDDLFKAYRPLPRPYRGENFAKVRDITQSCFNDAVNAIISVWTSIGEFKPLLESHLQFAETMNELQKVLDKNNRYKIKKYSNENVKLIKL
jgi:hypothetical protein